VKVWVLDVVGIVVACVVQEAIDGIKGHSPAVTPVYLSRNKNFNLSSQTCYSRSSWLKKLVYLPIAIFYKCLLPNAICAYALTKLLVAIHYTILRATM
jgi:hypothetical protein